MALAWLLRNGDIIAIPKTGSRAKLKENLRACEVRLDEDQLDALFPAPTGPRPLDVL